MLPVDSEAQAAQRQLDKVLASPGFARNERMTRFLRFVVERHLEGRDVRLGRDLTYPEFDLVRGDSRLKALRKKLGLPE